MTDIATLGLEIRSDGVVVASQRLQQMTKDGKAAEGATSKLSSATSQLTGYLKAAAAAFGLYKLAEYAKEAALLAARYQTLGVVMNTVGATAGYTNAQMAGFEKTLQKQGIAMVESRQVLTQMAQAHLDLAKSSELARVAQDAATIGGINSSEAFERMVAGIQKGETEILKTIGINVNFEQSYVKMALQLGKSRDALTETEKSTARMNAVLERGKDIAGVYEAAMGTAGKQLTSMKRYIDNLKVTAGSVFNDILIVGVQAFTKGLKGANTEAEKLEQENKLADWGKKIVLNVAAIADGFVLLWDVFKTFAMFVVDGWKAMYEGAMSFHKAITFDFSGARESFGKMVSIAKDFKNTTLKTFEDPTKYYDAANAMYAQRDASKEIDSLAQKRLEKALMERGIENRKITSAEELNAIIKKQNDEWGKIVSSQLESTGQYVKSTEEQIKINKLTDDYKTMVQAAKKVPEAAAALRAQELLDQQNILEAKRKELQVDTDHRDVMLGIEAGRLQTLGYDQESVYLKNGYLQALNEELALGNQIATEINPKIKAFLQEQLAAQQELNQLKKQQAEEQKRINDLTSQASAYNDLIKMAQANGANTKQLEAMATQVAYDAKRAQYQKAITEAERNGNDTLASITSQTLTQLDTLYSQKDLNNANLAKLKEILGVQQGITGETAKQNNLVDEYNASITISRTKDQQYQYDQSILHGQGNLDLFKFYGPVWTQFIENQAKERVAAYEREQAETKLIEDQKKLVEAINTAADRLSAASVQLANSGSDLAKSLRAAQANLLMAKVNLAGSSTSTLSPEQRLAMLRAQFTQTAATAQTTGDVNLFNQLPELARQLLEASQAYNASGAGFTADYNLIQQILGESANSAGSYATSAEQMVTLLQQQANLLTAIKTALETGGDTAGLLAQLNTVNGQVVSTLGTVNTSVGQTTAAANATATAVWTDKAVSDAINAQVANNTTSTANWLNAVNSQTAAVGSYTARTRDVLNGSLMASQWAGRVAGETATYTYKPNSTTQIDRVTSAYSYYAKGGIANTASIFGEAGPEAAVPLPDGRTIPVTLYGQADGYDKELMQEILAELKALTRVQVAGNNGIIAPLQGMEKRLRGVENKARLAANQ